VVLRIHFTGDDLARTRIATSPDAMWETLLSVYRLRRSAGEITFGRWQHESRLRLRDRMRPLLDLVPSSGSVPDFLTPSGTCGLDIDHGIDALVHTPRTRWRTDFTRVVNERTLPAWVADLADAKATTVHALAQAHKQYFHACLEPHWHRVREHIDRDVTNRMRTMAEDGVAAMLDTLMPGGRWRSPVLELDYPFDHDLHLGGRGLLLQPVFFGSTGTTLIDEALAPVLAFPVAHDLEWMSADTPQCVGDPLVRLLGGTRAKVLRAVVSADCTTTDLARRTETPLATASRHASILRDAALIASHRSGNAVVHAATPLGSALCNGRPPELT
jgi:DNA-binding transcriptional ArsR family regulator